MEESREKSNDIAKEAIEGNLLEDNYNAPSLLQLFNNNLDILFTFVSFISPLVASNLRGTCTFINENFQKWHNDIDYSSDLSVRVENDYGVRTGYSGTYGKL